MNRSTSTELPIVSTSGGCCGGSSCRCSSAAEEHTSRPTTPTHQKENLMTEQNVQSFEVTGMTCGHCASAVTDEIEQLPGVNNVRGPRRRRHLHGSGDRHRAPRRRSGRHRLGGGRRLPAGLSQPHTSNARTRHPSTGAHKSRPALKPDGEQES